MTEVVRGKQALIRFEGEKCIHSRQCVLGRPDVFVPNVEGEWIHPDAATPDELLALALGCPSGAIEVERLDGGPGEVPPKVNLARVRENGPLALHAEMSIAGHGERLRATLCRCGASAHKPFCDGSHTAASFQATGEPATKPTEPLAVRNGPIQVKPLPNGPLQVKGPLEIVSGTGRTTDRTEKVFFCRCGQSANKPYCDGTHNKVGFTAD
ncbi:MAG: CDGSH iron-sulfur domain-containing protein [Polyangiales bacterium]|nr:CDGSH iron-sulfur domain-containing protein [Myxococcales bacterium]MCB9660500.1 CDGSH iron-sulfur domain-containing protein [Sandaracinaceae bacterium]